MEKLIEVLKNRFKDIQIEQDNDMGCGGLLCKFNEETMIMAVFINTDHKWMIRYSPIESFDRWSIALGQDVLSEDIQSVIDWFSDDKNIIEMYEASLQDLSEYCESSDIISDSSENLNNLEAICKAAHVDDIGDVSDGYHTFNQLYYQRMMLFATIVKQNRDKAWKSLRHEDGELCFGGGWFIVGIDTPEGSYTYHYEDKYFDLFDCETLDNGKHWDGHTEKDVTRLLSLKQEPIFFPPCQDCNAKMDEIRRAYDKLKASTELIEDDKREKAIQTIKELKNDTLDYGLENTYAKEVVEAYDTAMLSLQQNINLDKIRSEIAAIEINGQVDEHTLFMRTGEQVKQMILDIIDKYKSESEG